MSAILVGLRISIQRQLNQTLWFISTYDRLEGHRETFLLNAPDVVSAMQILYMNPKFVGEIAQLRAEMFRETEDRIVVNRAIEAGYVSPRDAARIGTEKIADQYRRELLYSDFALVSEINILVGEANTEHPNIIGQKIVASFSDRPTYLQTMSEMTNIVCQRDLRLSIVNIGTGIAPPLSAIWPADHTWSTSEQAELISSHCKEKLL